MIPEAAQSAVMPLVGGLSAGGPWSWAVFILSWPEAVRNCDSVRLHCGSVAEQPQGQALPAHLSPKTWCHCQLPGVPVLWEPQPLGKHPVTKNPDCWHLYSRQEAAPSYERPTYETTHAVCNHSPALAVQGSLSLLETVTWKVTFTLTESSRRLALTHGRSPGTGDCCCLITFPLLFGSAVEPSLVLCQVPYCRWCVRWHCPCQNPEWIKISKTTESSPVLAQLCFRLNPRTPVWSGFSFRITNSVWIMSLHLK